MIAIMRVVVVEDNDMTQLGLKTFIAELADFRVVATFSSFDHVGDFLDKEGADILILDDSIPSLDTASILQYLRFNYPSLKVIVFGADLYAPIIRSYMDEGARAFIYQEERLRHCLAEGLHAVNEGRVFISHQASMLLLSGGNTRSLPKRSYQVLKAMSEGLDPAEIAKKLGIKTKAVYSAQDRLREQLGVRSNDALVAEGIAQGIIKIGKPTKDDEK